jgi:hypothetical protein
MMYRTVARGHVRADKIAILADKIIVEVAATLLLLTVIRAVTFETIVIDVIRLRELSRHGEELRCRDVAAIE